MRGCIGVFVERRHVRLQQVCLVAGSGDVHHKVIFDGQGNGGLDVVLEREVDIAGGEHNCSVDSMASREGEHETTWPMRDASRAIRYSG